MSNTQLGSMLKGQYLPDLTEQSSVHQILSLHAHQTSLLKENALLWKLATYENPLLFSKILLRFFKHSASRSKKPIWLSETTYNHYKQNRQL